MKFPFYKQLDSTNCGIIFSGNVKIPENIVSLLKLEVLNQENAKRKIHINDQYNIIDISRNNINYTKKEIKLIGKYLSEHYFCNNYDSY